MDMAIGALLLCHDTPCEPGPDGIPDECQMGPPPLDCNNNNVPDICDLRCDVLLGVCDAHQSECGASSDCNINGVPDECEIDENSTAPGGPFFCTADCVDPFFP